MSHENKKSLILQVNEALQSLLRIGHSKRKDKPSKEYLNYIYSYETFRSYLRMCCKFATYCKENHRCKKLDACIPYIDEWISSLHNLSPSTQKLAVSSLRKLYGRESVTVSTPDRKRADIQRSRGTKKRDRHFSESRHADLVSFCRSTGLRRHELAALRGTDYTEEDGQFVIHIKQGKGGKERYAVVIGDCDAVKRVMDNAGDGKVFPHIHDAADIHGYRSDYATAYYHQIARPVENIPPGERYVCRKDRLGTVYDRKAMLTVSRSLGHNRIDVIAGHYLDTGKEGKA